MQCTSTACVATVGGGGRSCGGKLPANGTASWAQGAKHVAERRHAEWTATAEYPWGALKRAEMLRHPCILGGHQTKGDKIRSGCLTPAFLVAQKRAEMLRHPCILGDPQTKGDQVRSRYLTSAFSGGHKREEVLRHPCIALGPQRQTRGQNQKWPTGGHIAYRHAFSVKLVIFLCSKVMCFFFAVNACRKKSSHPVIFFFAVRRVIFFFCGKCVYQKNRHVV